MQIEELISKYEDFGDAKILSVQIATEPNTKMIIKIRCMNALKDYAWEDVVFTFANVTSFRFVDNELTNSFVIYGALIEKMDSGFIIDFFPNIFENNRLEINPNSDFQIRYKSLILESVQKYIEG